MVFNTSKIVYTEMLKELYNKTYNLKHMLEDLKKENNLLQAKIISLQNEKKVFTENIRDKVS